MAVQTVRKISSGNSDDDFPLQASSPYIDAGDNNAVPLDENDIDDNGDTDEPVPFDLSGGVRFLKEIENVTVQQCPTFAHSGLLT